MLLQPWQKHVVQVKAVILRTSGVARPADSTAQVCARQAGSGSGVPC